MAIGLEWPVDGFGTEGCGGVLTEEEVDGPGVVAGPGLYGGGENEGYGRPALVKVIDTEVGEARDKVTGGDGGDIFGERDLGAVEGAVEGIGIEVGAGDGKRGRGWRAVEVGSAPGAVPGEG